MPDSKVVSVDIISDVMCPWCIVGYKQLEQALGHTGMGAQIRWHPFELNPDMPPEGENTAEHIMRKYGSTKDQSDAARENMRAAGQSLGFTFNFTPDSRIVNSFQAHQLLDFALSQGKQHPLKMALFAAYFTDGRDVSDEAVLLDVAAGVGLDEALAREALNTQTFANSVREKEALWHSQGITGVPTMIFGGKFLVTGAQGAETYVKVLEHTAAEAA